MAILRKCRNELRLRTRKCDLVALQDWRATRGSLQRGIKPVDVMFRLGDRAVPTQNRADKNIGPLVAQDSPKV